MVQPFHGKLTLTDLLHAHVVILFLYLDTAILFVISVTLVESYPVTKRLLAPHLRVFFAFFSLATLVLSKGYSGGLYSFMTVPLKRAPINTIQQVAEVG